MLFTAMPMCSMCVNSILLDELIILFRECKGKTFKLYDKIYFYVLNGRDFKYFEQFGADVPILFYGAFKRYVIDFVFTDTDHHVALIFQ